MIPATGATKEVPIDTIKAFRMIQDMLLPTLIRMKSTGLFHFLNQSQTTKKWHCFINKPKKEKPRQKARFAKKIKQQQIHFFCRKDIRGERN